MAGLAPYLVVQLVICLLGTDVFEMEAWAIKGLMSGTYETLTVVRPKVL